MFAFEYHIHACCEPYRSSVKVSSTYEHDLDLFEKEM